MPDTPGFSFEITGRASASGASASGFSGSRARTGRLTTPHGAIDTPAFIFCATKGAIKAATVEQIRAAGAEMVLGNTYHLMLQPGPEIVARMGGLHRFMNWDGPTLTDSGGFQIFSLGMGGQGPGEIKGSRGGAPRENLVKIKEEGAHFRSHIDGTPHLLTPERSIEIQRQIGADFVVMLDECTPYHKDKSYTAKSLEMTGRWGDRCLEAFDKQREGSAGPQALYGVQQGGVYADLRAEASEYLLSRPFFGHAVGGALGGDKQRLFEVIEHAMAPLVSDKPVHLLGIGGVTDIFVGVEHGIDTFDCVSPTRMARHGGALVKASSLDRPPSPGPAGAMADPKLNLRNARFKDDPAPLEADCPCPVCRSYSRAYIHHLLKADEILGLTLLTIHNIAFMSRLMAAIRAALAENKLAEVRKEWAGEAA